MMHRVISVMHDATRVMYQSHRHAHLVGVWGCVTSVIIVVHLHHPLAHLVCGWGGSAPPSPHRLPPQSVTRVMHAHLVCGRGGCAPLRRIGCHRGGATRVDRGGQGAQQAGVVQGGTQHSLHGIGVRVQQARVEQGGTQDGLRGSNQGRLRGGQGAQQAGVVQGGTQHSQRGCNQGRLMGGQGAQQAGVVQGGTQDSLRGYRVRG